MVKRQVFNALSSFTWKMPPRKNEGDPVNHLIHILITELLGKALMHSVVGESFIYGIL